MMAQYPSPKIAQLSYDFRTLGLGYANLGGLLMSMGFPTTATREGALWCAHGRNDRHLLRNLR